MDWLKWPRRAPISVEDGAPPPSTSGRKKLFAGSSIALALLAVAVCVWMQGERPGWTIVEASDMVRHAGQVPAETGGTVRTGEGLSVGALGKGTLRLKSTGTTLALTPNTSLRFDKAAKRQQVTLLSGAISAEASGLNASNPLVVRVQNSEVEASKAKFSTTITAKGFQLSVEEGEVGMNPGGGKAPCRTSEKRRHGRVGKRNDRAPRGVRQPDRLVCSSAGRSEPQLRRIA